MSLRFIKATLAGGGLVGVKVMESTTSYNSRTVFGSPLHTQKQIAELQQVVSQIGVIVAQHGEALNMKSETTQEKPNDEELEQLLTSTSETNSLK